MESKKIAKRLRPKNGRLWQAVPRAVLLSITAIAIHTVVAMVCMISPC